MEDLKYRLSEEVKKIDEIIDSYLPKEEGLASTVMTAMNYSIHVGGKRLRPMLMLETFRMLDSDTDERFVYPFMAAIEMIHTYSLCHDDLPAMDNDDMRRGQKSTHAKFGAAMGILAGDGLLNYAFETALGSFDLIQESDADDTHKLEMSRRIAGALKILAAKAGIYGMIGGQVVDIESEEKPAGDVTMETIMFIHENKTSAMIESSMMIGATLAGASGAEITTVEKIARDVGVAFQIRDDILDIEGDGEILGKPIGSDERNGKTTYVSLVGLDAAKSDVREISDRAMANLGSLRGSDNGSGRFLADLISGLVNREK